MTNLRLHHDEQVRQIYIKPSLVGIIEVTFKSMNTQLYERHKLIYEPDIIFEKNKNLYVVEYKCHECDSTRRHATNQLYTAREWFVNHHQTVPELIYAYEDFNYEVIR